MLTSKIDSLILQEFYNRYNSETNSYIDILKEEPGKDATVLATGGTAGMIVPHCRHDIVYEPDLLLKGLWYIYQKNAKES